LREIASLFETLREAAACTHALGKRNVGCVEDGDVGVEVVGEVVLAWEEGQGWLVRMGWRGKDVGEGKRVKCAPNRSRAAAWKSIVAGIWVRRSCVVFRYWAWRRCSRAFGVALPCFKHQYQLPPFSFP